MNELSVYERLISFFLCPLLLPKKTIPLHSLEQIKFEVKQSPRMHYFICLKTTVSSCFSQNRFSWAMFLRFYIIRAESHRQDGDLHNKYFKKL